MSDGSALRYINVTALPKQLNRLELCIVLPVQLGATVRHRGETTKAGNKTGIAPENMVLEMQR